MLKTIRPPGINKYFSSFIPKYDPVGQSDIETLLEFLQKYNNILVITGAGISTESGIPDYRSEVVGLYARSNHKPIQFQEYLKSAAARQRYWARNFIGWPKFSQCQPNVVHHSLTTLEKNQKTTGIITQNVDNLHFSAGARNVIELHGTSHSVICLNCRKTTRRAQFQEILQKLNPNLYETATVIRPDGDVEVLDEKIQNFYVPPCNCGGILKPDVVFFGDNVPADRVRQVNEKVAKSDSILVLGSTLTTFSSYRIILQGQELKLPIAIVNIGPTRADKLAKFKISTKCGDIIPQICQELFK